MKALTRWGGWIVFAALLLLHSPVSGAEPMPREAISAMGKVPIQSGGRVRPFDSFSRDLVREITGKKRWQGELPTYTIFRWMALPNSAFTEANIPVPYDPLRNALGLAGGPNSFYSMEELLRIPSLRPIAEEAQEANVEGRDLTVMQNKTLELMNRLALLQGLFTHQALTILPGDDADGSWLPPHALEQDSSVNAFQVAVAYTGLFQSFRNSDWDIFITSANRLRHDLEHWHDGRIDTRRLDIEYHYRSIDPWLIARSFYLLVLLFLMIGVLTKPEGMAKLGRISLSLGFVMHTAALLIRWYIGGRAPWSNMYESIVTITWGVVLYALFPFRGYGRKVILPAAALIGFASLTIASHSSLNPAINPLVPALQSYWLNIHVIVILMGYAAVVLATGAGHAWMIRDAVNPQDSSALAGIHGALYRMVQFAVLFLIVGILLGSVWAHTAWGRYWGWDPKETWALLLWFYYLGLIHAGYEGWIGQRGMAIASVFGFQLLLMTYYGVNYYLAGLHSYASGEAVQVPGLMIAFVLAEFAFIGWYLWHTKRRMQRLQVAGS